MIGAGFPQLLRKTGAGDGRRGPAVLGEACKSCPVTW